jgi:hypothetical protein
MFAEAKAIIEEVRSNADARVNRTILEADERIDRLKADAQNQIGRLQNELAQATRGIDQADARVNAVETEAQKRVEVIRRENEDKVLRLVVDLTEAKDRADRAEQWLMLIRREVEDHLMPAMRDGPKPTNSVARPRSLTVPTPWRSSASTWFRRLWLRVTSTATLGCRVRADIELASFLTEPPGANRDFPTASSVRKRAPPRPVNQARHCRAAEIRQP